MSVDKALETIIRMMEKREEAPKREPRQVKLIQVLLKKKPKEKRDEDAEAEKAEAAEEVEA